MVLCLRYEELMRPKVKVVVQVGHGLRVPVSGILLSHNRALLVDARRAPSLLSSILIKEVILVYYDLMGLLGFRP